MIESSMSLRLVIGPECVKSLIALLGTSVPMTQTLPFWVAAKYLPKELETAVMDRTMPPSTANFSITSSRGKDSNVIPPDESPIAAMS